MTDERCDEMHLLVQADLDGELEPGRAAAVAAHLATCPECGAAQHSLAVLSARLRADLSYHAAPGTLRQALMVRHSSDRQEQPATTPSRRRLPPWLGRGASFGIGFALAASLLLIQIPSGPGNPAAAVVADHIRALQPGHLLDVPSTDQHTVKPWFDGRVDFAPPVKDLAAIGFPLIGGRLDYLDGRSVAALVYKRRQHIIDLFVWPGSGGSDRPPSSGSSNGYNFVRWRQYGMALWAVSDLDASELADFVRHWQDD